MLDSQQKCRQLTTTKKMTLEDFEPGDVVLSEDFEIMYTNFTLIIYPNGRKRLGVSSSLLQGKG